MNFAHGEWANAGEVFEGSDFLLKGSVAMTQQLDQHLVVNDSTIRREYSVRLIDAKGRLVQDFTVTLRRGNEVVRARSKNGRGFATIGFTAANYRKLLVLSVTAPGISLQKTISLFTATPIVLRAAGRPPARARPGGEVLTNARHPVRCRTGGTSARRLRSRSCDPASSGQPVGPTGPWVGDQRLWLQQAGAPSVSLADGAR